jgi:outer membrane immunogenic protein
VKGIAIALLAGVAAVAGLGHAASAADLPVPPPPPPPPSWTGFYIGVHAGAAWQSAPQWSFFDPNSAAGIAVLQVNTNVPGTPALGGVGGLQAGYNWQFAPAWVVGVEGDISWASLADHRTGGLFFGPASGFAGTPVLGSSVASFRKTNCCTCTNESTDVTAQYQHACGRLDLFGAHTQFAQPA